MNLHLAIGQLNPRKIAAIKIHSNEGDIYTAHAVVGNELHTIKQDDTRQPCVFHSYIEAKRALSSLAVPITLETSAVYEEMVSSQHQAAWPH